MPSFSMQDSFFMDLSPPQHFDYLQVIDNTLKDYEDVHVEEVEMEEEAN